MEKISLCDFFKNAKLVKNYLYNGKPILPKISDTGTQFIFRSPDFPNWEIVYNDARFVKHFNCWRLVSYDFYVCKGVEGNFADYPEQDIDEIPPQDSIFNVSAQREEFIDWLLLHGF